MWNTSLTDYKNLYKTACKNNNIIAQLNFLNQIGTEYFNLKQYSSALNYYKKGVRLFTKSKFNFKTKNDQYILAQALNSNSQFLNNIGETYRKLFKYSKAIKWFEKSIKFDLSTKNYSGSAAGYTSLGYIYEAKKKYYEAIAKYRAALNIFENCNQMNTVNANNLIDKIRTLECNVKF
jgi:tetratricopeptide (TPR) repeat protein